MAIVFGLVVLLVPLLVVLVVLASLGWLGLAALASVLWVGQRLRRGAGRRVRAE